MDSPQNVTLVYYIDVIMLIEQYKQEVAPVLKAFVRHVTKDGERQTLQISGIVHFRIVFQGSSD